MIPEFSELMQRLEVERNDTSWKEPRELPTRIVEVPVVKTIRTKSDAKSSAEREKKMFHAGRYAAGARDRVAYAANEWLEKDLNKNENR